MTVLINIYYVLIHVAFVVWATQTIWFGIARKWEETEEGRTAFVTSVGLSLVFFILVSGIWWKGQAARTILALIAIAILIGAGLRFLWTLWITRKVKRNGLL